MLAHLAKFIILAALLLAGATFAYSQTDLPDASTRGPGRPRGDDNKPLGLREMLAKQKAERDKKDYEEMLDRAEEALRLTKQLEASYAQNNGFSTQDKSRLDSLEKVVTKIRKELGGDDDDETTESGVMQPADAPKPSNN